jgi:hypothetical protein
MKPIASPVNWIIAATVILLGAGCASTGTKNEAQPVTGDNPEPGKGLVIFYRESHFKGGGVGYAVRDFDEEPNTGAKAFSQPRIGALPNGSYFVYQATPGKRVFTGSMICLTGNVWEGWLREYFFCYCRVNVESNTIYYVQAALAGSIGELLAGGMSRPILGVVDSQKGSAAIKNLKRVTLSK